MLSIKVHAAKCEVDVQELASAAQWAARLGATVAEVSSLGVQWALPGDIDLPSLLKLDPVIERTSTARLDRPSRATLTKLIIGWLDQNGAFTEGIDAFADVIAPRHPSIAIRLIEDLIDFGTLRIDEDAAIRANGAPITRLERKPFDEDAARARAAEAI